MLSSLFLPKMLMAIPAILTVGFAVGYFLGRKKNMKKKSTLTVINLNKV